MRKAGLIYSRDTGKSAERSCKAVEGLLSTKRIVPARRSPKEWVLAMDNHNSSEGGETDSDFFKTERKDQDYPQDAQRRYWRFDQLQSFGQYQSQNQFSTKAIKKLSSLGRILCELRKLRDCSILQLSALKVSRMEDKLMQLQRMVLQGEMRQ